MVIGQIYTPDPKGTKALLSGEGGNRRMYNYHGGNDFPK
jgi:hypothetical protein